jgi:hypothetical protein
MLMFFNPGIRESATSQLLNVLEQRAQSLRTWDDTKRQNYERRGATVMVLIWLRHFVLLGRMRKYPEAKFLSGGTGFDGSLSRYS